MRQTECHEWTANKELWSSAGNLSVTLGPKTSPNLSLMSRINYYHHHSPRHQHHSFLIPLLPFNFLLYFSLSPSLCFSSDPVSLDSAHIDPPMVNRVWDVGMRIHSLLTKIEVHRLSRYVNSLLLSRLVLSFLTSSIHFVSSTRFQLILRHETCLQMVR